MLLIPCGELYVQPLNPSPCRLRFLESRVKAIGIDTLIDYDRGTSLRSAFFLIGMAEVCAVLFGSCSSGCIFEAASLN